MATRNRLEVRNKVATAMFFSLFPLMLFFLFLYLYLLSFAFCCIILVLFYYLTIYFDCKCCVDSWRRCPSPSSIILNARSQWRIVVGIRRMIYSISLLANVEWNGMLNANSKYGNGIGIGGSNWFKKGMMSWSHDNNNIGIDTRILEGCI